MPRHVRALALTTLGLLAGVSALGSTPLREREVSHGLDIERRRRALQLVQGIENSPDALLASYRGYGLPLPPAGARLVRYKAGGGSIVNRKVQPIIYGLAFEIKPATRTEGPCLLRGTQRRSPRWDWHLRPVAPEPDAVKDVTVGGEDGLALALQCHARGWDRLARYLLEKSQRGANAPPRERLVRMAWSYWVSQVTEPKIDRAPVARRLKELMREDRDLDDEYNRALLKSLELALVPSKARPGSVEALIDDLVDCDSDAGSGSALEPGDRYWRLARLGFDAVPSLLKHLDDDRLTRALMPGSTNFSSRHLRVADVAGDLLEGLAGQDLGRDWLGRQQGERVPKAEAKNWWDRARKVGEEPYLLAHAFSADRGGEVSEHVLSVIATKYPRQVPSLYRTVLDKRPELDSSALAEAVLRCKMPAEEKRALLRNVARHREGRHRVAALSAFAELDRKLFNELLLAAIEGIPRDVHGPYWTCPEGHIAGLAVVSDDPRVWATLERVARRSAMGLRMELLNQFGDPQDGRHRRERLRLLAGFLDDAALRDVDSSKKFDGPGAGFPYHRIEVRDFVALEIAWLVGIEVEVDLERPPEEWASIRRRVREAVEKELGEAPSDSSSKAGRSP
jgi:hypothetical protein